MKCSMGYLTLIIFDHQSLCIANRLLVYHKFSLCFRWLGLNFPYRSAAWPLCATLGHFCSLQSHDQPNTCLPGHNGSQKKYLLAASLTKWLAVCLMVNTIFFANVHAFSILVVMTNTTLPLLLKFNDATQFCELLIYAYMVLKFQLTSVLFTRCLHGNMSFPFKSVSLNIIW